MNLALISTQQFFQRIDAAYKALWPANDPMMAAPSAPMVPPHHHKPLRVVRVAEDGGHSPAALVAWSCQGVWQTSVPNSTAWFTSKPASPCADRCSGLRGLGFFGCQAGHQSRVFFAVRQYFLHMRAFSHFLAIGFDRQIG